MPRPRQKLSREAFISANPVCCYCNGRRPTAEIDHAPARVCFIKKNGPEGFEFPSCAECNRLTAMSEQVAAFYIRTFDSDAVALDVDEFNKLVTGIGNNAPGAFPIFSVANDVANPMLDPTGIAQRTVTVPPLALEHMKLFAMKVLYAIYYKTNGEVSRIVQPLPRSLGAIWHERGGCDEPEREGLVR